MQQRRGECQRRQHAHVERVAQQRQAKRGEDQADILDGGIGQQPLHVGLYGSEHRAEQRRDQSHRQRQHAPPPWAGVEQIETDPQHAVDRHLEHQATHHRRHRRWRGRMGFRQPHMQGHQARLGTETEQGQQEGCRGPGRRQGGRTHRVERHQPAAAVQHTEAKQQRQCPHVRHQQVQEAGALDFRDTVLGGHQEVRTERHGFPCHHEQIGVVGQHDQRHAGQKYVVLQAEQPRRRAFALPEVAGGEDGNAGPRTSKQQQEEA